MHLCRKGPSLCFISGKLGPFLSTERTVPDGRFARKSPPRNLNPGAPVKKTWKRCGRLYFAVADPAVSGAMLDRVAESRKLRLGVRG